MAEKWRRIKATRYEISNDGKIRNSIKGNVFNGSIGNHGYKTVCLRLNGEDSHKLIHRLVAIAFIENDNPERNCVNHIDGIKTNNHIDNLEWCTRAENNKHACLSGLRKGVEVFK